MTYKDAFHRKSAKKRENNQAELWRISLFVPLFKKVPSMV
jgi:hypothetical protein